MEGSDVLVKSIKNIKIAYNILSLCLLCLGIFLIFRPQTALCILCVLCGVLLILYGIVKLMGYFSKDLFQLAFQFDLAMGITSCIIGLILVLRTKHMAEIITYCTALFILVESALKIQTALDAKKFGIQIWWLILLTALVGAIVGVLLLARPWEGAGFFVRLLGVNLCLESIMNFIVVQSTVKNIRKVDYYE